MTGAIVATARLAKMPSDGIPYPLFSLTALIPWTFFANGLAQSSNSMVANSNLITKVYFPRLVAPVSAVLPGVVDFGIAFVLLLVFMPFYRMVPSGRIVLLPCFFLLALSHRARRRSLAICIERGISGRAAHRSFSHSVLDVRYPRRLSFQSVAWTLANPVRTEPDGGCD